MSPSRIVSVLLALFSIFWFVSVSQAQITSVSDPTSTPTPGVGHDYIKLLSETVNPATGSLSLRISVPVPQGRKLTIPFAFTYDSSGAWFLESVGAGGQPPAMSSVSNSNIGPLTWGGWSATFPQLSRVLVQQVPNYQTTDGTTTCDALTGYVFTDPSGARHSLGLSHWYNSYWQACQHGNTFSEYASGGDDFYRAALVGASNNVSNADGTPEIADPDGTVYNFGSYFACMDGAAGSPGSLPPLASGLPVSIEDRNGNIVNITTDSNHDGCSGFMATDTVGRAVLSVSQYGYAPNSNTISTVSVAGLSPYTVTWAKVSPTGLSISHAGFGSNNCWVPPPVAAAWTPLPGTNGIGTYVVTAIALPNGQQYKFDYDSITGFVNKITYPSGGYVTYTWGINPDSSGIQYNDQDGNTNADCVYLYDTPAISQRSVSFDGSTVALTQTFSYSTNWGTIPSPPSPWLWVGKQATVTTTDNIRGTTSKITYNYIPNTIGLGVPNLNSNTNGVNSSYLINAVAVENTISYYGYSPSYPLLRTETKNWVDQFELSCDLITLNDGSGQIAGAFYGYSLYGGQVTDKQEYDFGQLTSTSSCTGGGPSLPTPARETITTYQSFAATPIFSSGPSIFDRPSSIKIYGNGALVAETDYSYDQSGVAGVTTPSGTHDETNYAAGSSAPRGNVTTITKQCFPNCTNAVTTYTYDETGQVLSMKDPCGNATCSDMIGTNHTATYSYIDNFDSPPSTSTNAYLTQVTDALGYTTKYKYAYSDGQLIASTDQNSQTTNYSYNDPLRRLKETDYPTGGKTTFNYSDTPLSPTITTSKLITSTLSLTSVAVMDGLGHTVQTQMTSDPDGTDYTDTTYDGSGLVWKQSNPHRSSSLPSDGTTTNYFDALERLCLVVPPDGTLPTGTPCASQPANTVFTSYSGNIVTVTDQVGASRVTKTDGLGHLIEVDEPGFSSSATPGTGSGTVGGSEQSIGGTPATPGTGSAVFSGTLQSKQVQTQAATAGTGSVTLSGNERSIGGTPSTGYFYFNLYYPSSYSSETITLYVNGSALASQFYSAPMSGYTLAQNFANQINGNPLVTASYSGNQGSSGSGYLNLTSKAVGTSANYSLSYSCSFCSSYTSYSGMSGGTDPFYDNGTVSVTVNGVQASVSYGQNSTVANLASALVTAINGNTSIPVTAGVSGTTVNLTAKTTGAGTNYSLSVSSVTSNTHFQSGSTSFPISGSGATLTGGQNAVYTTVYDSGSCTVTVNSRGDSSSWSGSGTTTSSIASSIAAAINADSGAFVNANPSANTVSLTARTTGVTTNYPLSSSCTYDSSNFSSPSFTTTNSGGTLTGGTNAGATTYDSGTVWIKVAGFQATTSYGQNDTQASVASGLANALNSAGSPVTASASSGNITLSARATGANTNFAFSGGSSTSQPTSFSQPSFTISVSGSTLTGGSSPTLSLSTPAVTTYNYDALGNLISATQSGSRQRTFTYDSLSRLVCASNPENSSAACPTTAGSYTSGTIGYAYDANSNLTTNTAPAPNQPGTATVTTALSYDALDRLTQKSYSDGTHTVSYGYDGIAPSGCSLPSLTIDNGVGKRTGMCDAAGAEAWSYDIVSGTGWKTTDMRTTSGVTLTTVVQHNLDGSINGITYPSGHIVSYGPGGAGRPLYATDTSANISYATNAHYWPSGTLAALSNGSISFTGILNSRLQPCWIYATTGSALSWNSTACNASTSTGSILDLQYNFNLGSADNGNVTATTNNRDTTRSQTFAYDPLNRLITAQTNSTYSTSPSNCFGESFGYDTWGNLLSVSESSSSYDGCVYEQPQSWTIMGNNQIQSSTACFDGSGNLLTIASYCYDAAGNLLTNTALSFSYDAENHLKSIPMLGFNYLYDGDGRRAAKLNSSGQATKLYWYGLGNDPLDETDGTGATNNSSFFEYAFFNDHRIARRDASNNVSYYFADHLGTARVVTDGAGTILDDSDFYPFGGERIVISSSGNNYKFTGKERDSESSLDNFGARYFGSSFGRFMRTDPSSVGGDIVDSESPQSWNMYSYVLNNPLSATDPDGLDCIYINNDTGKYEGFNRGDCDNSTPEKANSGYYVNGTVDTISTTTGDASGVVTGYTGTNNDSGTPTLLSGTFNSSAPPTNSNSDALNPFAQGVFTQLNQMDIMNNTLKIYGASAVIGITGGAACYYLCEEAGALTLGEIRPGPGASKAARLVAQGGKKALQRGIRSLMKKIAEHEAKIQAGKAAGEFTSSMEAEVANWKSVVQAMENILRTMP